MGSIAQSFESLSDERVDASGMTTGQFIGPSGLATAPGSLGIRTGDYGDVSLSGQFAMGMSGAEVLALMGKQADVSADIIERQAASSKALADLAITGMSAASAGQSIDWKQYLPVIVIGLVAVAVATKRSRGSP